MAPRGQNATLSPSKASFSMRFSTNACRTRPLFSKRARKKSMTGAQKFHFAPLFLHILAYCVCPLFLILANVSHFLRMRRRFFQKNHIFHICFVPGVCKLPRAGSPHPSFRSTFFAHLGLLCLPTFFDFGECFTLFKDEATIVSEI